MDGVGFDVFGKQLTDRAGLGISRLGFREVGIYERHAQLDGIWRDCVIVERLLGHTNP